MMKIYLFLFVSVIGCSGLRAQVIVNSVNLAVPCGDYSDSIDYDSDGTYDFKIESFHGIDNNNFKAEGIGDVTVASPMSYGQTTNYYYMYSGLNSTTMGCYGWSNAWLPGSGTVKYVLFRDPISAGDTIFGWAALQFHGAQNSCEDTMILTTIGHASQYNLHLTAGQTSTAGLESPAANAELFQVTTSPDAIHLTNTAATGLTVQLFTTAGQLVTEIRDLSPEQSASLSKALLPGGVYFLSGSTSDAYLVQRIYLP